jgi:hypothetical protein
MDIFVPFFSFSYLIKTIYLFVDWYTYGPDGIWRDNQHWGAGWRSGGGKGGIIEKNRGSSKVGGGRYLQPIPNNGKKTGGGYVLPIPGTGKEGDT